MTHANIKLPTGQRVIIRCSNPDSFGDGGFRWSVNRWQRRRPFDQSGWQGYLPVSERVALGLLAKRVKEDYA